MVHAVPHGPNQEGPFSGERSPEALRAAPTLAGVIQELIRDPEEPGIRGWRVGTILLERHDTARSPGFFITPNGAVGSFLHSELRSNGPVTLFIAKNSAHNPIVCFGELGSDGSFKPLARVPSGADTIFHKLEAAFLHLNLNDVREPARALRNLSSFSSEDYLHFFKSGALNWEVSEALPKQPVVLTASLDGARFEITRTPLATLEGKEFCSYTLQVFGRDGIIYNAEDAVAKAAFLSVAETQLREKLYLPAELSKEQINALADFAKNHLEVAKHLIWHPTSEAKTAFGDTRGVFWADNYWPAAMRESERLLNAQRIILLTQDAVFVGGLSNHFKFVPIVRLEGGVNEIGARILKNYSDSAAA